MISRCEFGMVPVATVRSNGSDVRVARFAPSNNIVIATFCGGGMAWADAAMKQGKFAVPPSPPDVRPDLAGLSCRYEDIPAARGLVLSVVVVPAPGANPDAFRAVVDDIARLVEASPQASRPVPGKGLRLKWPPQGHDLEARAQRGVDESLVVRKAKVLALTFLYFLIMRLGIGVGRIAPRFVVGTSQS